MAYWRAYIDKSNGDHSRFYDFEANHPSGTPVVQQHPGASGSADPPELPADAKLKKDEVLNQIVQITEIPV